MLKNIGAPSTNTIALVYAKTVPGTPYLNLDLCLVTFFLSVCKNIKLL